MGSRAEGGFGFHLRALPFDHGIIALSPAARLDVNNLLRLVIYAKSKKAYPSLSFSVWHKWSRDVAHLDERLAWMYFETFDLTSDVTDDRRLKFSKLCAATNGDEHDLAALRGKNVVKILPFVVFLFLQHFGAISLKANAGSDIKWPSSSGHVGADLSTASRRAPWVPDDDDHYSYTQFVSHREAQRIHFLSHALPDILRLLGDPELALDQGDDAGVSYEGLEALHYLFDVTGPALAEAASSQGQIGASGFSKISRSFAPARLSSWLLDHLRPTHPVPQAAPREARPLVTVSAAESVIARLSRNSLQRGDAEGIAGSNLCIHHCSASYIYLLSSFKNVAIHDCRKITILVGAVEGTITLTNSRKVTLIATCRRLVTSNIEDCTVHVACATQPVLSEGTHNLTLAPYHTSYGALERHMGRAMLLPELNLWNSPLPVIQRGPYSASFRILPPDELSVFLVPFLVPGDTTENPCGGIPPEYAAVRRRKLDVVAGMRTAVDNAALSDATKAAFRQSVESRFMEWLQETGEDRQLQDLIGLEKDPSGTPRSSLRRLHRRKRSSALGLGVVRRCEFRTDRLNVADWHSVALPEGQDLCGVVAGMLTPAVTHHLPPSWHGPYSHERACAWITDRDAESTVLLASERASGAPVGLLILVEMPGAEGGSGALELRLGYLLAGAAQGRGLATELVGGLVAWCRQQRAIRQLHAGVAPDNPTSARVLTKNGFALAETRGDDGDPDGGAGPPRDLLYLLRV